VQRPLRIEEPFFHRNRKTTDYKIDLNQNPTMKLFGKETLTALLLCIKRADSHFFWLQIHKETNEVEVSFSEKAGVPSDSMEHISSQLKDGLHIYAMSFHGGRTGRPSREEIEWSLQDNRIIGSLPVVEDSQSHSTVVIGRMDFGPFSRDGIDVDDLQQSFKSDQLVRRQDAKRVHAHDKMKVKPFYLALKGCGPNLELVIHGLSARLEESTADKACFYEVGGREIGCEKIVPDEDDDDVATVTIASDLKRDATIFAMAHGLFPSNEETPGKGTAKYATISADYTATCVESEF